MAEETALVLDLCLSQVVTECSSAAEHLAESQRRLGSDLDELATRLNSVQALAGTLDTSGLPKATSDLLQHQEHLRKLRVRVNAVRARVGALESLLKERP